MTRVLALSLAGAVLVCSNLRPVLAQKHTTDGYGQVSGQWLMEVRQRTLVVQITSCGPEALCGTIVGDLSRKVDPNHGAASGQDHPVIGWQLLREFTRSDDGNWHGQMVNFMNGRPYKCLMRLESSDRLRVRPYMGIPTFGMTHIWPRYQQSKKPEQEN